MITMNNFTPPKKLSSKTICEKNLTLISANDDCNETNIFPEENLAIEKLKDSKMNSSGYLRNEIPLHVKLISAWYNQGFTGIFSILSKMESEALIPKTISIIATYSLKICEFCSLKNQMKSSAKSIDDYSSTIERQSSHVRCIAWHPQCPLLAIATRFNCIKIRRYQAFEENKLLQHAEQFDVSDISWRPFKLELAVGCSVGILLWDLEVKRMSLSSNNLYSMKILKYEGHSPVTSLSWQHTGQLLASSSANQNTILIWQVDMETCSPLHCLFLNNCPSVAWAPNGSRFFSSSTNNKFSVWETKGWTNESWLNIDDWCQASCWSPDGRILLFASSQTPVIFSLTFMQGSDDLVEEASVAPVIDVSLASYIIDGIKLQIGGLVHSMVWDVHGSRLAVLFKNDTNYNQIALYQTRFSPKFTAIPIGFINGMDKEYGIHLKFMPSFEQGSLLTVAWSSGRLSHIPLYHTSSSLPFQHS